MNWRRLWLLPLAVAFVWVAAYAAALPKAHILSIAMQQGALVGDESAALLSAITMPKAHMLSVQVQPSIAKALPQAFSVASALPAPHILHVQVNRQHIKKPAVYVKPKVKIVRVIQQSGTNPFNPNSPATTCPYTGIWTGTSVGGGLVNGSTCAPGYNTTQRQIGITVASDCSWKDAGSSGGGTIDPATGTFTGTLPAGANSGPCAPTRITGTLGQNSGSGRFTDLGGPGTWTLTRGGTLPVQNFINPAVCTINSSFNSGGLITFSYNGVTGGCSFGGTPFIFDVQEGPTLTYKLTMSPNLANPVWDLTGSPTVGVTVQTGVGGSISGITSNPGTATTVTFQMVCAQNCGNIPTAHTYSGQLIITPPVSVGPNQISIQGLQ